MSLLLANKNPVSKTEFCLGFFLEKFEINNWQDASGVEDQQDNKPS